MNLQTPVSEIIGIGESYGNKLQKMGIINCQDLLFYLPKKWNDFSQIVAIKDLKPETQVSVKGKIWQIDNRPSRNRMTVTEAVIADDTGTIKAVWFNQPFLTKSLNSGDDICLAGKVEWARGTISMLSPAYEKIDQENDLDLVHTGRLVPVYRETEGVSSKWLRAKIKLLIKLIYSIRDYLPEEIKKEYSLIDLPAAIRQLHFPESKEQLEKALDRLDFDEVFLLQLTVLDSRKKLKEERSLAIPFNEALVKGIVAELPFVLTGAQKRATWEALQDMAKPTPMNRLIQGDVGSGKTIVASILMCNTAIGGSQAVLLCPTEILAKQHYQKIVKTIEQFDLEAVLITGSTKKEEKESILNKIKEGESKIIIGTHALLEKGVEFWRLGLAIVDEQHRFGVEQRAMLRKESLSTKTLPHFLSMTATPIPRTLSLTIYGDLDISLIDELPSGRKKPISRIVTPKNRSLIYRFVAGEIDKGRQAFVICPLIGEESAPDEEKKTVLREYERLSKETFADYKVAYLYGKMKTDEKDRIMSEMISGKIDLLVATSVIEVGVDIPNATIILIEGGERFGLSQLHQFRGRILRSSHQAYCFVSTDSDNETVLRRLEAFIETNDGFKLAEVDLQSRGPGDYLGSRQHGLPDIKMKNLTNLALIKKARQAAENYLTKHNLESKPLLNEKAKVYNEVLYLE